MKIWHDLVEEGIKVARCTVVRLMKAMGIQGITRGDVKTTKSNPALPCPEDKVNRDFKAPAPNRLWVADFTYVRTAIGFVYVAFIIDVFARYIVGWKVSSSPNAQMVLDALEQALAARNPDPNTLIHHSDAGFNTWPSNTPSAWKRPKSIPQWAASETAMTMPWLRQSTASTKQKSSNTKAHGKGKMTSKSPP